MKEEESRKITLCHSILSHLIFDVVTFVMHTDDGKGVFEEEDLYVVLMFFKGRKCSMNRTKRVAGLTHCHHARRQ